MQSNVQKLGSALLIFVGSLLCAPASYAQSETLEVTITYRERIALPPHALLSIEVIETADSSVFFDAVASQVFRMETVPMTVTLSYDVGVINDEATYSVAAAIISTDGTTLFHGKAM